jgi:hypothetical protein
MGPCANAQQHDSQDRLAMTRRYPDRVGYLRVRWTSWWRARYFDFRAGSPFFPLWLGADTGDLAPFWATFLSPEGALLASAEVLLGAAS